MLKITSAEKLREQLRAWRAAGDTLGFVPTMGYLHDGHLSLFKLCAQQSSKQIVSIFVNPTQFNSQEDFQKYPREFDRDLRLLETAGANLVFMPSEHEIYGPGSGIRVEPGALALLHEGEFRPGHFSGVLTVVSILFNLVQPDLAVFGEKDFQQLRLVEQMVAELHFDLRIIRAPTVRESDGLAMSSRNARLSQRGRRAAALISAGLFAAQQAARSGERSAKRLCQIASELWSKEQALQPEYLRLIDERTLIEQEQTGPACRLIAAVHVEGVRLIDNMKL